MLTCDLIFILLGAGIAVMGVILWKKQKIKWVSTHAYVQKKDYPQFSKINGIAMIGFGVCMAAPGLFDLLNLRLLGWIVFAVFLIAGLTLFFIGQKYNQ